MGVASGGRAERGALGRRSGCGNTTTLETFDAENTRDRPSVRAAFGGAASHGIGPEVSGKLVVLRRVLAKLAHMEKEVHGLPR